MEIFNSTFGMQQLNGNFQLLSRLLTKFIDNFQNTESELRDLIEAQDYEQAAMVIHTMKGVTGNLGLEQLHQKSSELEQKARRKELSFEHVQSLSQLTSETIKEVNHFINTSEQSTVISFTKGSSDDPLSTLRSKLQNNQFIPSTELEKLLNGLKAEQSIKQSLHKHIQLLEYEKALGLLETL